MPAAVKGQAASGTQIARTTRSAVVTPLCAVLLFLLTGCSSEVDETTVPPETVVQDTPPTSVAIDACIAAREAERRAAVDVAAPNREMDARISAVHRDSEAAAAEFSDSVAAAVSEATDRAKAEADPVDPDGEYAAWLVSKISSVSPNLIPEVWDAIAVAWERIDRERDSSDAELAVRHVSAFQKAGDFEAYERAQTDSDGNFDSAGYMHYREQLRNQGFDLDRFDTQLDQFLEARIQSDSAFRTASHFTSDVLWQVAAMTESELSQRIVEGQRASATDIADFAEASAREVWVTMRARSTVPENYSDAEATAIFDAARVVGRAVLDSPGPLAEIAAGHVQRVADIEASPLADEIGDASAELRRAQAQVVDACEQ